MLNTFCVSNETGEKRGVVGIGKVERNRNRETWDNAEKHGQRKKRTNADINITCFSEL